MVARCWTGPAGTTDGAGSASRKLHHGSSVSWTMSMVIWCSTRFLSDASSSAALRWSASGSPVRGVVPAIGWARTMSPTRETSSSGLAPTKSSTAKHSAAGWDRRSRASRVAASSGWSVRTSSSRASTTLVSSPARMRSVASATASHQSSGARTLRTCTSVGRHLDGVDGVGR